MPAAHDVVFETERLRLRRLVEDDAAFILELVNDEAWLKYIGDRNVRSLADARRYIATGPRDMYERVGFGLWLAVQKVTSVPIGLCGLIKRDSLEHPDLGFALLPAFRGSGYALEAARATLGYGTRELGMTRILAITTLDNTASIRLLTKLGFRIEGLVRLAPDDTELNLYAVGEEREPSGGYT